MTPNQFLASLINTVAVLALVQLIKVYLPVLKISYPWVLPLIAAGIGPIVAYVEIALGGWLGVPVDLKPIAGVFTGSSAVMLNQVGKQWAKGDEKAP